LRLTDVGRFAGTSATHCLLERTAEDACLELAEDEVVERLENVAAVHLCLACPLHHLLQAREAQSDGLRRPLIKLESLPPDCFNLNDMILMLRCHVRLELVKVVQQALILFVEFGFNNLVNFIVPVFQLLFEDAGLVSDCLAHDLCHL